MSTPGQGDDEDVTAMVSKIDDEPQTEMGIDADEAQPSDEGDDRRESLREEHARLLAAERAPCADCGKPVGAWGARDGRCAPCVTTHERADWMAKLKAQIAKAERDLEASPHHCRCGVKVMREKELCDTCRDKDREHRERLGFVHETLDRVPSRYGWAAFPAPELASRVHDADAIKTVRAAAKAGVDRVTLLGKPGAGKSVLAVCFASWRAYHAKLAGRFVDCFSLAGSRVRCPLGAEAPEVEEALEADLLILDDLGAERNLESSPISEIVYARHGAMLPTVVTSGFSREALLARYGGGVARRLFEGACVVEVRR